MFRTPAQFVISAALALSAGAAAAEPAYPTKEALGEALFFDVNLSKNRTQSCATCHDPNFGFADPRETAAGVAVSLGDDGQSLGDRNAPTAAYAAFSPAFHRTDEGLYVGGQFWDGRASTLADQAGGPPLNPIEMGLSDEAEAVARIKENADYVESLKAVFGDDLFDDEKSAYGALTASIAAFEKTAFFAPFDSKYDRYLRGEYKMTKQEELGRTLFFSQQFTNCGLCHQLQPRPGAEKETFSNYEHHNIGVPANMAARSVNGVAADHIDRGLAQNPAVDEDGQAGKYKTPSLRNVAVTGPYMHNGVFRDLKTVILFYNQYNSKASSAKVNPETGAEWGAPEIEGTLSMEDLTHGPALDEKRVDALVAFLETLTDARYEDLLEDRGKTAP